MFLDSFEIRLKLFHYRVIFFLTHSQNKRLAEYSSIIALLFPLSCSTSAIKIWNLFLHSFREGFNLFGEKARGRFGDYNIEMSKFMLPAPLVSCALCFWLMAQVVKCNFMVISNTNNLINDTCWNERGEIREIPILVSHFVSWFFIPHVLHRLYLSKHFLFFCLCPKLLGKF